MFKPPFFVCPPVLPPASISVLTGSAQGLWPLLGTWRMGGILFYGWHVVIAVLRSVAPLSYALVLGTVLGWDGWDSLSWGPLCAFLYACSECIFHLWYVATKSSLQTIADLPHCCQTPAARFRLVEQCISALRDGEQLSGQRTEARRSARLNGERHDPSTGILGSARNFLEGWFVGSAFEEITYADFARWCAWAFFNRELEGLDAASQRELHSLIDWYSASALQ